MLKPLGDRVVVIVEDAEETTVGGLVLAGVQREATKIAHVVAVGDGTRTLNGDLIAPSVSIGDKVLIENGVGIDVNDGSEKVSLVRESDILAILQ